jgi:hypothetical protein
MNKVKEILENGKQKIREIVEEKVKIIRDSVGVNI